MKYTYLLLHPSSSIYVDYIFSMILNENFVILNVYRISNWDTILYDIYRNSFRKSTSVYKHVFAHAYINKYMFGNYGLLVFLSKKNISIENLINDTLDIKRKIRKKINETKNNGTIEMFLNNGNKIIDVFLSYLHCPDTKKQYCEDFETFRSYAKEINILSETEIRNVLRYHSYFGNPRKHFASISSALKGKKICSKNTKNITFCEKSYKIKEKLFHKGSQMSR